MHNQQATFEVVLKENSQFCKTKTLEGFERGTIIMLKPHSNLNPRDQLLSICHPSIYPVSKYGSVNVEDNRSTGVTGGTQSHLCLSFYTKNK